MMPICQCTACLQATDYAGSGTSAVSTGVKWGSATLGTAGGTVTWSYAAQNYAGRTQFNFSQSFLTTGYESEIQRAFDAWEAVANIKFEQVADASNVNIRIGGGSYDGQYGVLGYATWWYSGGTIQKADIFFDNAEDWTLDTSGISVFSVAVHEIGHAIGLAHLTGVASIMNPYNNNYQSLKAADVAAIQEIYGAEVEATALLLTGSKRADTLHGNSMGDTIYGGAGSDKLYGSGGDDTAYGDAGNDKLHGGDDNDTLYGGAGKDTLYGQVGDDWLYGGDANDVLYGDVGNDRLYGDAGNDKLYGDGDDDELWGGAGNDSLYGGAGNDTLVGGAGIDVLSGGLGADVFRFDSTSDSPKGKKRDVISDFNSADGDMVDLSGIDADIALAGDQEFAFIGASAFSKVAGELSFLGGVLRGDVNGDGVADFEIVMSAVASLQVEDLVL